MSNSLRLQVLAAHKHRKSLFGRLQPCISKYIVVVFALPKMALQKVDLHPTSLHVPRTLSRTDIQVSLNIFVVKLGSKSLLFQYSSKNSSSRLPGTGRYLQRPMRCGAQSPPRDSGIGDLKADCLQASEPILGPGPWNQVHRIGSIAPRILTSRFITSMNRTEKNESQQKKIVKRSRDSATRPG